MFPGQTRNVVRARVLILVAAACLWLSGMGISAQAGAEASADPFVAEASRLFDRGNYQQAVSVLRGAIERERQRADLHYWLQRCYFELGQYDQAVMSGERAVEFASNNSEYHQWLGRSYGRKAEHAGMFSALSLAKKTRKEFEEAVRLNPANFSARRDLIEFYFSAPGIVGGGDDKARSQISELSKLDPVEGRLAQAQFWIEKKKPELADREFRAVLDARPGRVKPYYEAAEFYLERADAVPAETAVEAAARVDPANLLLDYYRGAAWALSGSRLSEAEGMLQKYLATVPDRSDFPAHAQAHVWLGLLDEKQGWCAAAAGQYRQAQSLDPQNKRARDGLRGVKNCVDKR